MNTLDIHQILQHLPHRYPMLLVDRVLDCQSGKSIVALKNVTINEHFFAGHYPYHPVMPGVLIVEALAQTAAILSFASMGEKPNQRSLYYFVGIDGARFKRPVGPGDQLRLEVEVMRSTRGIWKFKGLAFVEGKIAVEAELMCTIKHIQSDSEPSNP